VLVVGAEEGRDGDEAVAAGTVLNHDWLAPALRQPLGEQPRSDVGPAAWPERQHESDRALRPRLG